MSNGAYDGGRVPDADHNPLQQLEFDLANAVKFLFEAGVALIEISAEVVKDLLAQVVGAIIGGTVTLDNMVDQASEWAANVPVIGEIWAVLAPYVTGVAHTGINEIRIFFENLHKLLDVVDFMNPDMDRDEFLIAFLNVVLFPLNMVPRLIGGLIPGINIPGLDGSKIVSGHVAQSFLDITSIAGDIILGELSPDNIPGIDAAKIISGVIPRLFLDLDDITAAAIHGVLDPLNIPGLDASVIVSGTLAQIHVFGMVPLQAAVDSLLGTYDTLNTAFGTLDTEFNNMLNAADYLTGEAIGDALYQLRLVGGFLSTGVIPGLDASKIISGQIDAARAEWAAHVQDVIEALGGLGAGVDGLRDALAHIPLPNLQGIFGPPDLLGGLIQLGNQINAGLQGLASWIPGFQASTTQIGNQATQVYTQATVAYSVSDILKDRLALRAIRRQSYLGIDPSADPNFPFSEISTTMTTVNITQTKSLMAAIPLQDTAGKQSVCWYQTAIANVTNMYVTIYQFNRSTGAITRQYVSGDLMNTVGITAPSNTPGFYYHNLPMANYFTATEGEAYAIEIRIVGTGSYTVLGKTVGTVAHPVAFPAGEGVKRTSESPSFLASGTTAVGATPKTSTIDIPADCDCLIVPVSYSAGLGGGGALAADVDGTNLPVIDSYNFVSGNGIAWCGMLNPPSGNGKVVTISAGGYYLAGKPIAYKNVASFGAVTKVTGSGTAIGQTIANTADATVVQVIADNITGATFTSYSKTARLNAAGVASQNILTLAGDFVGSTASQTGSVTGSATGTWGSMMMVLNGKVPPAPATIPVPTFSTEIPWMALCGEAAFIPHAPEIWIKDAPGTYTYPIPLWAQVEGTLFDIVGCGSAMGGTKLFSTPSTSGGYATFGGVWNADTWEYGIDIPLGTASLTIVVPDGGAGTVATTVPAPGDDGDNTTVTGTSCPLLTCDGGVTDSTFIPGDFSDTSSYIGRAPTPTQNYDFNGITYPGGAPQENGTSSNNGVVTIPPANAPGGGGCRGLYLVISGPFGGTIDLPAGKGAPGIAIITAYQPD